MKTNIFLAAVGMGLAGCASSPESGASTTETPAYNDNMAGQGNYNNNGAALPRNTSPDNNGINDNANGNGNYHNNGTNFNTTPDSAPVIITNLPPGEMNNGAPHPPAPPNNPSRGPSTPAPAAGSEA